MPNVIATIEKYMKEAVDTVFMAESKTKILENGSKFIDVNFKEAGYVKIFSMLMDGLSDYYRVNNGSTGTDYVHYQNGSADGYKKGNVEGSWEIFKLNYDRGKQFQIDSMDDEETAGLIIGNLVTEFVRTKVVPEVDALRFSKMASKCSTTLGNLLTAQTINANAIIADFNAGFEWLTEHEVPSEEQVIFVNPSTMTLIRNTTELAKFLTQADYRSEKGITFDIEKYGERPIIEVPSSRFFTNIVIGDNGYYPSDSSKIINYMICSKKAIVPVVKLNKSKIWTPEQVQDFDGYKVNFRLYHDVIIPKNKVAGIYCSVSDVTTTTKVNTLELAIAKSGNDYVINESYTTPAGMLGTIVHSASAFTLGDTITIAEGTIEAVEVGTAFTALASDEDVTEYFALVDANGVVLAVSGGLLLGDIA